MCVCVRGFEIFFSEHFSALFQATSVQVCGQSAKQIFN